MKITSLIISAFVLLFSCKAPEGPLILFPDLRGGSEFERFTGTLIFLIIHLFYFVFDDRYCPVWDRHLRGHGCSKFRG